MYNSALLKLLSLSEPMSGICAPLSEYLNTPYFNFVRRFTNDKQFFLTTDPEWSKVFYEKKLYQKLSIEKGNVGNKQLNNKIIILPWSAYPNSPVVAEQKKFSGIANGISLAVIKSDYTDFYHFGSYAGQNHMTEYYLSNIDLLLSFSHYFHEKSHAIIAKSYDNHYCIKIPKTHENNEKMINLPDREVFKDAIKQKKLVLDILNKDVVLSEKEKLCLKFLIKGLSSSEIGKILHISKRTVETHIENIKFKTETKSKSDLIKLIIDTNHLYKIIAE